jgi:tRNA uridine 5-carboxymethylaminomethyl modification enzyme
MGFDLGLLPERNHRRFLAKAAAITSELHRLRTTRVGPDLLIQILRRPEMTYRRMPGADAALPDQVAEQVEINVKYEGYVDRQEAEVGKLKSVEQKQIPDWLKYDQIPSLRTEARVKLEKIRPATLGQASRISGVSPADISVLMVWLRKGPGDPVKDQ